jgi:hypothetical protein
LWDEARVLSGPEKWNNGLASPVLSGDSFETISVGPDTLRVWRNNSI